MKCNDVKTFFSQVSGKSLPVQAQLVDLNYLSTNGFVTLMQKPDYDKTVTDVSTLTQKNMDLQNEIMQERSAEIALAAEERKTHSIFFHFEGRDKKEADLQNLSTERDTVTRERTEIASRDSEIGQLIQKKSMIDRMVPLDGQYVSLTGLGVVTLNDLNVRNYRVSDTDFSQFVGESRETSTQLQSIAGRSGAYESSLVRGFQK